MSELVKLKDINFSYAQKLIIKIDHFEVNASERVFLYGPSGCGKSTLLNIIAGTLKASSGEVNVCAKDMTRLSASARDRHRGTNLGYIFQSFNLIPYLSILENVMLPIIVSPKKSGSRNAKEQAIELISSLGLKDHIDQNAGSLSVGQRQRVAAARSLMGNPSLIIADEPTSSLDEVNTDDFLQLLLSEAKQRNLGLLFVSHDRRLEKYFERSVELPSINKVGGA